MALTHEQRTLRAGRLGSSDAKRIMSGRWRELWREKTGRAEPDNLDLSPAVQIGIATEHLHPRFYAHRTGIPAFPAGERSYVHPEHGFIVAHLDFLTWRELRLDPEAPPDTILEAKFHAGFKSDEELAEQYYWQIQHQMLVSGHRHAVLSVLRPSGYGFLEVPYREMDAARLLETLKAFWWFVENDVEPEDPSAVRPPDFETLKVLDMSRHNEFSSLGAALLDHRDGARTFREAEGALKALMPRHARIAYLPDRRGSGVFLLRSRDGKLSLRFGDVPGKYRDKVETWTPDSFDGFQDMEGYHGDAD